MSIGNWLKQAVSDVGRFGSKVVQGTGAGMSWLHQNVLQPGGNFLKKIPVIGAVAEAATPLADLVGTAGNALQGKGSINFNDFASAAEAIPRTMAAGISAKADLIDKGTRLMEMTKRFKSG